MSGLTISQARLTIEMSESAMRIAKGNTLGENNVRSSRPIPRIADTALPRSPQRITPARRGRNSVISGKTIRRRSPTNSAVT